MENPFDSVSTPNDIGDVMVKLKWLMFYYGHILLVSSFVTPKQYIIRGTIIIYHKRQIKNINLRKLFLLSSKILFTKPLSLTISSFLIMAKKNYHVFLFLYDRPFNHSSLKGMLPLKLCIRGKKN